MRWLSMTTQNKTELRNDYRKTEKSLKRQVTQKCLKIYRKLIRKIDEKKTNAIW